MLVIESKVSQLTRGENGPQIMGPKRYRISGEELRETLGKMFERGEKDPDYFSKPMAPIHRQAQPPWIQGLRFRESKSDLIQRRNTLETKSSPKDGGGARMS